MKAFFFIFAAAIIIAAIVTFLVSLKGTAKKVTNFDECVRANYQVFDTFPKQCQTPAGDIFTEVIETGETEPTIIDSTAPDDINNIPACISFCGNGFCNTDVECQDDKCSCREDMNICPQDCGENSTTAPNTTPTIKPTSVKPSGIPTNQPTAAVTPTPDSGPAIRVFENNKIKFEYPKEWQIEDKSKDETYGLEIIIKSNIYGVREIKIIQEEEDLKNVRPDDIIREDPFVISNRNGFRWRIDSGGNKRYDYFTSGPNMSGTLGVRIKIDAYNKNIEEKLNSFVDTFVIKNK